MAWVGQEHCLKNQDEIPQRMSSKRPCRDTKIGQPKKYTEKHGAKIIAQACTDSSDGRKRWTLTLLTEEMNNKDGFYRRVSIENGCRCSRPLRRRVRSGNPLVCFDEKTKQLLGDNRISIPINFGSPVKYEYEYARNCTANIFMTVEFKTGKRVTHVAKRRNMGGFCAICEDAC